jgi:glyoxylase-like metal-dependent hydrolase (beta-lactamase superfamily II)
VIVERTEHPGWLSNAYLIADREGGHGVIVDSNGVDEPLVAAARRLGVTVTHVLVTHHHEDHVVALEEQARRVGGVPVLGHPLARERGVALTDAVDDGDVVRSGELEIRVIATPGHCPDHLAFLVNGTDVLTADCLFRGTVGGTVGGGPTGYADQVRSIMERLIALPPETRVHPGHREPTTIGAEWEANPFVRVWRGLDSESASPCTVRGEPATLVLWAPDYDGGYKAWVRYPDGRDQIVGGSQVTR